MFSMFILDNNGNEFAKAVVISVNETIFQKLSKEDKEGHEKFASDREMYRTYSRYYKTEVGPQTKVKVVKFKLV